MRLIGKGEGLEMLKSCYSKRGRYVPQTFTLKQAWAEVGGLSKPSKMPTYGYSLSAFMCKVGSRLREIVGSACHECYARKGRYVFPNVQKALDNRLHKLNTNPNWVGAMIFLILHYCTKSGKFRWHDSGDLQSLEHLCMIVDIAKSTPDILHWLPTQEGGVVKKYKQLYGAFPDNLVVRMSASMVNGVPPKHHTHTSTVATDRSLTIGKMCPSSLQGNKCLDCWMCWDKTVDNITYLKH